MLAASADAFASLAPVLEAAAEVGRVASVTSPSAAEGAQRDSPGFFGSVTTVI